MRRYLDFVRRVLSDFARNRGLLLAGGVAFNVLLSVIPLLAVVTVALSHVVSEERLLEVVTTQLRLMVPSQAESLATTVGALLDERQVIGWVGLCVMIFFSSLAFRMLEDAIAIIFRRHAHHADRRVWVSTVLPYLYVLALSLALAVLTALIVAIDWLSHHELTLLGLHVPFSGAAVFVLWTLGFLGVALLFASIYKVLPVINIPVSRAAVGGVVAAALWEIVRGLFTWWLDHVSVVDTVYGSLGTAVIALLYLEAAAVILLLGAQVIAEFERSDKAGVRWYEDPGSAAARPLQGKEVDTDRSATDR
ncbi:MAG: YihY/virulence factor BrkB family protein [Gammaproteobacteria bacterium]|nr:YihY/virulence factor BrkB family protein [Gammaproteobacteria bacterium]